MSIGTRTVIDQIEIRANGTLQIRLLKQIVNGDAVVQSTYHRTAIEPGGDCDALLAAVGAHLAALGFPRLSPDEWQRVKDHAAVAWTPDAIAAWRTGAQS